MTWMRIANKKKGKLKGPLESSVTGDPRQENIHKNPIIDNIRMTLPVGSSTVMHLSRKLCMNVILVGSNRLGPRPWVLTQKRKTE